MLVAVVLISVLRTVIGVLMKGLGSLLNNAAASSSSTSSATSPPSQHGSDLHRDPVCGTFVVESTPFQKQIFGQKYYFCSSDCREKHALAAK